MHEYEEIFVPYNINQKIYFLSYQVLHHGKCCWIHLPLHPQKQMNHPALLLRRQNSLWVQQKLPKWAQGKKKLPSWMEKSIAIAVILVFFVPPLLTSPRKRTELW